MSNVQVISLKMRAYHRACFATSDPLTDKLWNVEPKSIMSTWSDLFSGAYDWLPAAAVRQGVRPPVPKDIVEVFTGAEMRVLFAQRPDVQPPDTGFVYTTDWQVGSVTQGTKTAWPYSRVRDVVLAHLVENLSDAGKITSENALQLPALLDREMVGLTGEGSAAVTYDGSVREAITAAIRDGFFRTRTGYTLALNDVEPTVDIRKVQNGHADVVVTSSPNAIVVEPKGTGYVDVQVLLYAVPDGHGQFKLYGVLPNDVSSASDAARAAATAWDEQFKRALVQKTEGRAVTMPPATRPEATTGQELLSAERAHYDAWWNRSLQLRSALADAPEKTASDGWSDYVSNGGTMDRQDWDANAAARENAAASLPNSGFVDGLGTALGWAGTKTVDGIGWLGNSALDLLKSWGPTGTLQVYGGVKAVDAVADSSSGFRKYLPWLVGGAILLWVTK